MAVFSFKNVHIESFAVNTPPHEVTSADLEDRLSALYTRLGIPFGTLERLSGIKARRFYDSKISPSQAATVAAKKALDQVGFDHSHIKALFNCSVTRDHFEPATASIVHQSLGLSEDAMTLDVTNACLGFSNGLMMLGNMIETGVVKAGIVVSAETISRIIDTSIRKILQHTEITREELLKLLPTFTLGSGAVAYVLCHESIATKKHKIVGGSVRSASQFSDLCVGNADFCYYMDEDDLNPLMHTESPKLIGNAAFVGQRAWNEFSEQFGWTKESIDTLICHQVGKQAGENFFKTVGIDNKNEFTIYQKYGNQVSAALPTAVVLAEEEGVLKKDGNILLTGFGSGLNAIFTGITW